MFKFFLFVNMVNLPNLLYSLAVDGNSRKEKGGRKEKKKKKKEAIRKTEAKKDSGACNPKFQQKTMQKKGHPGGNQSQHKRMRMETRKQPLLSIWKERKHHTAAVNVTQIKGGSSQKKPRRGKSLFLPSCDSAYSGGAKLIILVAE